MKATIGAPLTVKAAGDLANGNYPSSVFQARREGGNLLVSGTNGHVSCCASVKATFERWPEGKCITFGKDGVCAMMRALGKGIRRASEVTFELSRGIVTVSAMVDGAEIAGRFSVEGDPMRDRFSTFDWRNPKGCGGGGSNAAVSPHMLRLASAAAKCLCMGEAVTLAIQGEGKPVRLDVGGEVDACVVLVTASGRSSEPCSGWSHER